MLSALAGRHSVRHTTGSVSAAGWLHSFWGSEGWWGWGGVGEEDISCAISRASAAAAATRQPPVDTPTHLTLLPAALIDNKSKEITRLNSVYNSLLKNAGVEYLEGKGSLVDAHTVKVLQATLSDSPGS